MLTVTKRQLYLHCANDYEDQQLPQEQTDALKKCDIKHIVVDFSMSENHLGGDDVVDLVDATLKAIKDGYAVATWYGPEAEVLVVGYRPTELAVTD